jgi:hypothetical protein
VVFQTWNCLVRFRYFEAVSGQAGTTCLYYLPEVLPPVDSSGSTKDSQLASAKVGPGWVISGGFTVAIGETDTTKDSQLASAKVGPGWVISGG